MAWYQDYDTSCSRSNPPRRANMSSGSPPSAVHRVSRLHCVWPCTGRRHLWQHSTAVAGSHWELTYPWTRKRGSDSIVSNKTCMVKCYVLSNYMHTVPHLHTLKYYHDGAALGCAYSWLPGYDTHLTLPHWLWAQRITPTGAHHLQLTS